MLQPRLLFDHINVQHRMILCRIHPTSRDTSKVEDIELVYVKVATREDAKVKDKNKEQPMLRSAQYRANQKKYYANNKDRQMLCF